MKHTIFSFIKFGFQGSLIAAALFVANIALAIPVNINTADADTIADALRGVGEKTAQKIVAYREKNGNFEKPEDLMNIKGIGVKKLAVIKSDVLINKGGVKGGKSKVVKTSATKTKAKL